MSNASRLNKGYILVAVLSAMIGGLVVVLATRAIPKMLAQTMDQFMQKMMTQMEAKGCSPSEM